MTREEAIKHFEAWAQCNYTPTRDAALLALSALTPPTQEQVERVFGGHWVKKHRISGGFRRKSGIDDMGEQRTITVDERVEYDDLYCSICGKQRADNFLNFCPSCGLAMTPEALEIIKKKLEALKDESD